jgi:hypothetical protein
MTIGLTTVGISTAIALAAPVGGDFRGAMPGIGFLLFVGQAMLGERRGPTVRLGAVARCPNGGYCGETRIRRPHRQIDHRLTKLSSRAF